MTATLDDILQLIAPPRVIVAAPYSAGQEVLLLHLVGQPRSAGWVLPTVQDCERMKLDEPTQHDGYLLVRVAHNIDAALPPKCDRASWICAEFLLELPLDPDTLAAIAAFNRTSKLDKFLAYADSINQPTRNTHV